jgi:hypothetical protein
MVDHGRIGLVPEDRGHRNVFCEGASYQCAITFLHAFEKTVYYFTDGAFLGMLGLALYGQQATTEYKSYNTAHKIFCFSKMSKS